MLTTVERDGEWYLSPTRTIFEQFLSTLRALEPEDIENFESLFGGMFGMGMGLGMSEFDSLPEEEFPAPEDFEPGPLSPPPPETPSPPSASAPPSLDCFAPLEELPPDASAEDIARAGDDVQSCLDDAPGN